MPPAERKRQVPAPQPTLADPLAIPVTQQTALDNPRLPIPAGRSNRISPPPNASITDRQGAPTPPESSARADITQAPPQRKVFQPSLQRARGTSQAPPAFIGDAPDIRVATPNVNLTAAVVGLNTTDRLKAPPPASRPAQVGRASELGIPNMRDNAAGLEVPDVAIAAPKRTPVAVRVPADVVNDTAEPSDFEMPFMQVGLSAPLRPSSRVIPAAVEHRFRARSVYTLVIPRPRLQRYAGDWVLWFADTNPQAADGPVRAPVPLRKRAGNLESAPSAAPVRLLVDVIVSTDGSVRVQSVLNTTDPRLTHAITEDIERWRFRPALRNNAPIDVEAILEMSFAPEIVKH